MVVPAAASACLLAFWAFAAWRVRVERGRVLEPPLAALSRTMRLMTVAFAEGLVPVVRRASEQLAAFNEAWQRAIDSDPDLRALLDADRLPDGYTISVDDTPLLPEGDTQE